MNGNSGFFSVQPTNTSGFVSNASQTSFSNGRRPVPLGHGFVAIPIWQIRRANQNFSQEEVARAKLLSFNWNPKGTAELYPQRCPAVWVDNFTFLYTAEMAARGEAPQLLLGRWKKECEVYGTKQMVEGLVVAGGGHKERMANKPSRYNYSTGATVKFEDGDMSLIEAANKELKEEIGIDRRNVRDTYELGWMEDPFNDPRMEGLRYVFLRHVEQNPRPTEELPNVLSVPVTSLGDLCSGRVQWRSPDGKEMGMVLNHDKYIDVIMSHSDTQEFLLHLTRKYAQTRGQSLSVF
jgi:ADP-ribose pyrophosphatase YjhB (NUDIX family)